MVDKISEKMAYIIEKSIDLKIIPVILLLQVIILCFIAKGV